MKKRPGNWTNPNFGNCFCWPTGQITDPLLRRTAFAQGLCWRDISQMGLWDEPPKSHKVPRKFQWIYDLKSTNIVYHVFYALHVMRRMDGKSAGDHGEASALWHSLFADDGCARLLISNKHDLREFLHQWLKWNTRERNAAAGKGPCQHNTPWRVHEKNLWRRQTPFGKSGSWKWLLDRLNPSVPNSYSGGSGHMIYLSRLDFYLQIRWKPGSDSTILGEV